MAAAGVWAVPGQPRVVDVLSGAVTRQEVAHAWGFTGPAGVGQEQAARALMAALNCPEPQAPCGACGVCRRALRGAHPAYWEFAPTGATHRVADVRQQWLPAAFRTAPEGRWKVLRILDADRMNDAAANAFLKGLEEPPPRTAWILDVTDPDELPDTILSRCREVRFAPWGPAELDAEAVRLGLDDPDDRALAVRACMGAPAQLRRLAEPGGLDGLRAHREIPRRLREDGPAFALVAARALDDEVKRRTAVLKARGHDELADLDAVYSDAAPRAVRKQVGDRLARREREARTAVVQAALDDLAAWYRDVVLVATGGAPEDAIHRDDPQGLRADAAAIAPDTALRAMGLILAAREHQELNVQQGLALEALFMDLSALSLTG